MAEKQDKKYAWLLLLLIPLALKSKKKVQIIVDPVVPEKSKDADVLVLVPNGTDLWDDVDGSIVGRTSTNDAGGSYFDAWLMVGINDYVEIRDANKYYYVKDFKIVS